MSCITYSYLKEKNEAGKNEDIIKYKSRKTPGAMLLLQTLLVCILRTSTLKYKNSITYIDTYVIHNMYTYLPGFYLNTNSIFMQELSILV